MPEITRAAVRLYYADSGRGPAVFWQTGACGEHEHPRGEAELAVAALSDGAAVILPGLGHLQAFWHSEITMPHLRRFLDKRVPAVPG